MNSFRSFLFLIGLSVLISGVSFANEKVTFQLEGIVEGVGQNPQASQAVIDGEFYKVGDRVRSFELISVNAGQIELKDAQSGENVKLNVGERYGELLSEPAGEIEADSEPSQADEKPKNWLEQQIDKVFPQMSEFIRRAGHAGLIQDLRKVQMSAMIHALETGDSNIDLKTLVAKGDLPAFFSKPRKDGYVFRILPVKQGVRVHLEPTAVSKSQTFFLMDEHSYIYAQEGKRATPNSPRFDTGYSVQVT